MWSGKDGYVGKLEETEKQYIIQIRVNKLVEWVLVYGGELKDDELKACMGRLESIGSKNKAKEVLKDIFGDVVMDDFKGIISRKYADKITWKKYDKKQGANNITLVAIVIEKDIVDSKGMKDSDKKEDKENNA